MTVRTALLRLVGTAIVVVTTVIGCGAPSALRSVLPPRATGAAAKAVGDQEAALERSVADAYAQVTGARIYGVVDDGWYEPAAVPGRPGYYFIDGDEVPGPPDDPAPSRIVAPESGPVGVAPDAAATCVAFTGSVPPPCTATGPFRRVYSGPGYSFALAHLTLPANITTMPTAPPKTISDPSPVPLNGDTGYVYFEGWVSSNPNAGNSEFGFQYSAKNKWYSAYYKAYSPASHLYFQANHYLPTTPITLALAGFSIAKENYIHVAVLGTTKETCVATEFTVPTPTNLCLSHTHAMDTGWTPSACCIMARMTTIGQIHPNKFYDGVAFGPIKWSGVELAKTAPTPAPGSTILPLTGNEPPWISAGEQNWPPQLDKIVVTGSTAAGETDTVNLTKLPTPQLALSPSVCQKVKPGATVKYTVKAAGATGLALEYGWGLSVDPGITGDKLTVPGASYNSSSGLDLGPGTAASVFLGSTSSGYVKTLETYLYFRDATGVFTSNWNGNIYRATDSIEVGSVRGGC